MPHDVIAFGEVMVRLAPPHFQRLEQARSLDLEIGGAELNTAAALQVGCRGCRTTRSESSSATASAKLDWTTHTFNTPRTAAAGFTSWSSARPHARVPSCTTARTRP